MTLAAGLLALLLATPAIAAPPSVDPLPTGTDVDYQKASETVRASLESKGEGFGAPVENVDCPKGVEVEVGAKFECTVRYPDGTVAYALLIGPLAQVFLPLFDTARRAKARSARTIVCDVGTVRPNEA